ncbi:uncharacterized protein DS421_18g622230 [Arachis hypogaea]|nr:uncharacterized protein DS421_18g622230 [Arachis hypogaea]
MGGRTTRLQRGRRMGGQTTRLQWQQTKNQRRRPRWLEHDNATIVGDGRCGKRGSLSRSNSQVLTMKSTALSDAERLRMTALRD